MIEFADETSVNKAMLLASKKLANIAGKAFKIYKAGTGTYICKTIFPLHFFN